MNPYDLSQMRRNAPNQVGGAAVTSKRTLTQRDIADMVDALSASQQRITQLEARVAALTAAGDEMAQALETVRGYHIRLIAAWQAAKGGK